MHLKALKLQGFKSFADATTLSFEPGVTAVVGPNGCGKSNIADAIRWVLGEQSAKALRGGKMQDVIFEGADTRRPAQLCEVSLLLTDCEKQLGSEFHEIEIMRRVHRDGQGEYFFNGKGCRLKDIQKLFMDTGIGRTSYSIMAQGQIDQILSSKPEERRAVFEEAAGITRYKSQRREAMGKLALTEQNLARVADVIGEVGRQIGSLRRQAAKAIRYKRLAHRQRALSLAWSGWQHGRLSAVLADLEARVGALRSAAEERRTALESRQAELDGRKAGRSPLTQRVQEAQQSVFDVRSERGQAENAAQVALIKRSGLEDRLSAARETIGEIEMQLREVAEKADTGAQDKQLQLGLLGSSDAAYQQRNQDLGLVEGRLSALDQELQQARFQLLQTDSRVARLRTDCSGYEVDQKTSKHRHEALLADVEKLKADVTAAVQAAADAAVRTEAAGAERTRTLAAAAQAQESLTGLTRDFKEGQRKLQEIDRQLAQRGARLKLLQQLQEKFEGFGEGAKAVLQGRLKDTLDGEHPVAVSKGLEVRAGFGRAVEALLGATAEAIEVTSVTTAHRIIERLEREQIGSVLLRVAEVAPAPGAAPELPAGLVPAVSALDDPEGSSPAHALLGACYVADDLGAFLDFWKAHPGFEFLAVATRKGEVADRRGVVAGGHTSGRKSNSGIVQREIDLRETAKALAEEQRQHDAQKARIDLLAVSLASAEKAIEERRAEVLVATQTAASVQAEQRNADRAREDVVGRQKRMEQDLQGVERARNEAQERWQKAQVGMTEAEAEAQRQRERIAGLETSIVQVRTERDARRDALAQARLDLAERRQKVEVLDRGLGEMQRRRRELSELFTQRTKEIQTWTAQIAQLGAESEVQRVRAETLAGVFAEAQGRVETARTELMELERVIAEMEAAQESVRQASEAAHGELSRHEVKLAETRQRVSFLTEEVTREFQAEIGTLDWKALLWTSDEEPEGLKAMDLDEDADGGEGAAALPAGADGGAAIGAISPAGPGAVSAISAGVGGGLPVNAKEDGASADAGAGATGSEGKGGTEGADGASAADAATTPSTVRRGRKPKTRGAPTQADLAALEGTDWEAVKRESEALRQRLTSMGPVNLVAIEEYAELKQRHDFLKGQVDDLTRARTDLVAAIDEINETSQKQFSVTFEQIKKNFTYTFQTLFGGGKADIELVQSEDVLESGIEIVAQPPGTKLRGITLLSGGQKTLTAVALLFALYLVKPSPFCLLDELDAPLDESNIGRFTDLLKKFVKESQFIIITHNKRTIAAATAIYGVTMEERGVSRTVSMRFNQERGEAEVHATTVADAVRQARGGQGPVAAPVPSGPPVALSGSEPARAFPESVGTGDEAPAGTGERGAPQLDGAAESGAPGVHGGDGSTGGGSPVPEAPEASAVT